MAKSRRSRKIRSKKRRINTKRRIKIRSNRKRIKFGGSQGVASRGRNPNRRYDSARNRSKSRNRSRSRGRSGHNGPDSDYDNLNKVVASQSGSEKN
tara:strand:+ start:183 stop:470 length:288 start_codon:yes stop_codon:yes gene_type:complete